MRKRYNTPLALAILALALVNNNAFAFHRHRSHQAPPSSSNFVPQPEINAPAQSTSAPFDGGLTLLIAAGVGFASKRAYNKRKLNRTA